jgi:hypothetical protein
MWLPRNGGGEQYTTAVGRYYYRWRLAPLHTCKKMHNSTGAYARDMMTHSPLTLLADMMITDAEALMQKYRVVVL